MKQGSRDFFMSTMTAALLSDVFAASSRCLFTVSMEEGKAGELDSFRDQRALLVIIQSMGWHSWNFRGILAK